MEDPEQISAAILLPKFKTGWTEKADVIEAGVILLCNITLISSLLLFICFLPANT